MKMKCMYVRTWYMKMTLQRNHKHIKYVYCMYACVYKCKYECSLLKLVSFFPGLVLWNKKYDKIKT